MLPRVSIIIPSYNNALLLKRTIESLIKQTYENWEAIIVDNSSTDNTEYVVNRFNDNRLNFYTVKNNGIIAFSRNYGIKKSKADILAFLDSDDWWCSDKLEISLKYLTKYDFVYHDLYIRYQDIETINKKSKSKNLYFNSFKQLLINGNCIPNSSVVVKKSKIKEIGYIDESVEKYSWEDYDAWLKLAQINIKFKRISKVLGYYWIGSNNITNDIQIKNNIKNFLSIYKKQLLKSGITTEPWWCSYLLGITYSNKNLFHESNKYFLNSIKKTFNINLISKSLIRIILNYYYILSK